MYVRRAEKNLLKGAELEQDTWHDSDKDHSSFRLANSIHARQEAYQRYSESFHRQWSYKNFVIPVCTSAHRNLSHVFADFQAAISKLVRLHCPEGMCMYAAPRSGGGGAVVHGCGGGCC